MLGQIIPADAITEDIQFVNYEGENVHRITGNYCGHVVQVIQYNKSPCLIVGIDSDFQQVHKSKLAAHIESMTGGAHDI